MELKLNKKLYRMAPLWWVDWVDLRKPELLKVGIILGEANVMQPFDAMHE
jgi:hypothetical protein